jgi:hypothetical protein
MKLLDNASQNPKRAEEHVENSSKQTKSLDLVGAYLMAVTCWVATHYLPRELVQKRTPSRNEPPFRNCSPSGPQRRLAPT